jgi:hypothetical protein
MEFILYKASDWSFRENIQLNSIEELVDFAHEVGSGLIIGGNVDGTLKLTIYDDYIE